jgi:hypothetical protein
MVGEGGLLLIRVHLMRRRLQMETSMVRRRPVGLVAAETVVGSDSVPMLTLIMIVDNRFERLLFYRWRWQKSRHGVTVRPLVVVWKRIMILG